jgi:hypothetical protein
MYEQTYPLQISVHTNFVAIKGEAAKLSSDQLQGSRLGIDDEAVRLGMDKAGAKGKAIGRSVGVERVDAPLVVQLRNEGESWREIAEAPAIVKSSSGKQLRPSVGSIRWAGILPSLTHRMCVNEGVERNQVRGYKIKRCVLLN